MKSTDPAVQDEIDALAQHVCDRLNSGSSPNAVARAVNVMHFTVCEDGVNGFQLEEQ